MVDRSYRSPSRHCRAAVCLLLGLMTLTVVGCKAVRPMVLPVVGSMGEVNGQWDDLDLYLVDPTGAAPAVRVTNTPELMETDPDLNRDRDRLVYAVREATEDGRTVLDRAAVGAGSELYISSVDGQEHRLLHRSDNLCFTPVWSHDGKRIAFVEMDAEGRLEVKLISADGSGLQTLGYGSGPSWRKDDLAVFYNSLDRPDAAEGNLLLRELGNGVIHELGLPGTGHTNLRAGVSIAYTSTPYSRRNETVWLMDANGGQFRLTDPGEHEHDVQPLFFGSEGELVFTRYNDADETWQLMSIHRRTEDRVATPIDQPTPFCMTRGGLWVALHYPR